MNREEALERVRGILVEQLGVDEEQVTEDASFQGDLDADSLDLVELIMELEDAVAEKLQPLVRRSPVRRPRGVREDVAEPLLGQPVDQTV